MRNNLSGLTSILMTVLLFSAVGFSQTTEFTYQGSLQNSSVPANGNFDFEFLLFDAVSGGNQIGATLTRTSVAVAAGTFAVKLDFGASFPGANRFVEIRVRTAGGGAFTPLAPRQLVNSSPYSVQSLNATNATNATIATLAANATQLGGLSASGFIQNTTSPQASSNFNVSGTGTANYFNALSGYNIGSSTVFRATSFGTGSSVSAGAFSGSTTGMFNAFFGAFAGNLTSGIANSFFGSQAGMQNQTGTSNSFFGNSAGQNTLGSTNSFFGRDAGIANSSGSDNTLIGAWTNVGASNLTNATAIGANVVVSQSNSLVLGNGVNVGIGTTGPAFKLEVVDSSNTGLRVQTNTSGGTVASFGGNGDFYVDAPSYVGGRLTILENGNVGININNPVNKLDVAGIIAVWSLGSAGATPLCQNASLQISYCSSSIRYKQNVNPFGSGLALIKQLRPVSFNWRADNLADFGLVAEEVGAVEPLLTTTNDKGEIEGVKYDRVGVVLINAVKEQQTQIEAQQEEILKQKETNELQQKQIEQQRKQIERITKIVCAINSKADICRP